MAPIAQPRLRTINSVRFTNAAKPTPGLLVLEADGPLAPVRKVLLTAVVLGVAAAALYVIWVPMDWRGTLAAAQALVRDGKHW
jgi:hypothetical protein